MCRGYKIPANMFLCIFSRIFYLWKTYSESVLSRLHLVISYPFSLCISHPTQVALSWWTSSCLFFFSFKKCFFTSHSVIISLPNSFLQLSLLSLRLFSLIFGQCYYILKFLFPPNSLQYSQLFSASCILIRTVSLSRHLIHGL